MVNRRQSLSERQMEVLKWVVDGCPDGRWEDYSYKRTTYALADRGLVVVDRRRNSWSAQVTEDGRNYLEHRRYPQDPDDQDSRPAAAEQQKKRRAVVELSTVDLVAELQVGDGVLTIPDPAPDTRASYRRATSGWATASQHGSSQRKTRLRLPPGNGSTAPTRKRQRWSAKHCRAAVNERSSSNVAWSTVSTTLSSLSRSNS
ncbi:hypothetical protein [Arthrobacter sp. MMS24-S77]